MARPLLARARKARPLTTSVLAARAGKVRKARPLTTRVWVARAGQARRNMNESLEKLEMARPLLARARKVRPLTTRVLVARVGQALPKIIDARMTLFMLE